MSNDTKKYLFREDVNRNGPKMAIGFISKNFPKYTASISSHLLYEVFPINLGFVTTLGWHNLQYYTTFLILKLKIFSISLFSSRFP